MIVASGQKVALRRATIEDRANAYEWMARSDLTPGMLGAPVFADLPVPGYETFCELYEPYYFEGSRPFDGRALVIRAGNVDIGFLGYGPIDLLKDVVEIDLWLAASAYCGYGYGSDALDTACSWLQDNFGVNRFVVRPSRRNVRGLRVVRRAGFRETDLPPAQVLSQLGLSRGRYFDEVLMFRVLRQPPALLDPVPGHIYVFVDSEFTNLVEPRLISIGAVATDATAFYCELTSWPPDHCSDFVRGRVLPLLDGAGVPHPVAAESFARWLRERGEAAPTTLVSDSGFDRWAISDLLGTEELPPGVQWLRVPVPHERLDDVARGMGLRRHHALDDARALRQELLVHEPDPPPPLE